MQNKNSRSLNNKYNFELIVCGGGPAGIAAAYGSAKCGVKTALIEREGFLGGNLTAALVSPMMTFHTGNKQVIKGFADLLVKKLTKENFALGYLPDPLGFCSSIVPYKTEGFKKISEEILLSAGVQIFYHSEIIKANRKNGFCKDLITYTKGEKSIFSAKNFIDCTGDGVLLKLMNFNFLDEDKIDFAVQPATLIFKMRNINLQKVLKAMKKTPKEFVLAKDFEKIFYPKTKKNFIAVSGFFKQFQMAKEKGEINIPRDRVLFFCDVDIGEVGINMTRVNIKKINCETLTYAEIEGRRQMFECVSFLKKYIPGFENACLSEAPKRIGIRESKRVMGEYVLNEENVVNAKKFSDGIACGAFPIDLHSPKDEKLITRKLKPGEYYHIPYRSLIPKNSKNILVAGRCFSATQKAHASARLSPTCMAMGQSAGIASALSAKENTEVKKINIKKLQNLIIKQNGVI